MPDKILIKLNSNIMRTIMLLMLIALFACNQEKQIVIPKYEILDKVNLISGKKYADILIASYSLGTPADTIEGVLNVIAEKEKLDEIGLYCSHVAMKAAYSSSYADENPEALKCCLGSFKDRKFIKNK